MPALLRDEIQPLLHHYLYPRLHGNDGQAEMLDMEVFLMGLLFPSVHGQKNCHAFFLV
jgi:hypothetical protein